MELTVIIISLICMLISILVLGYELNIFFKTYSDLAEIKEKDDNIIKSKEITEQEMLRRIDRYRKQREKEREVNNTDNEGLFDDDTFPSLDDLGYFTGVEEVE